MAAKAYGIIVSLIERVKVMLAYEFAGFLFRYNGVRTITVYTVSAEDPWITTFIQVSPNADRTEFVSAVHDWVNNTHPTNVPDKSDNGVMFTETEKREIIELNDFPYFRFAPRK